MTPIEGFKRSLRSRNLIEELRLGLIGASAKVPGPYGYKPLIYADYVASGRALEQIEDLVRYEVLPFYANSHTEASYCGAFSTRLRESARAEIARMTGATEDFSVVFTGSGATNGLNRMVNLLDIPGIRARGGRVVVMVGPYEHHSNLLPWRESGAETVEIPEASTGGPDLEALEAELRRVETADLILGAFSAASNVTGILTDPDPVTRLLKRYGALAIWDYACGAPYIGMDMRAGMETEKDAIVFSTHKFPGGPGASGIMVIRNSMVRSDVPTFPGGGTVSFVSPWSHIYSPNIAHREEAGTPNVVGDVRAALVMLVKEAMGQEWLDQRHAALRARALAVWRTNPAIEILGNPAAHSLPIFSFRVRDGRGGYLHHQFFTRLLSDLHGIQARGGCACAGSYAHRLLGLDRGESDRMRAAIQRGLETEKPGWIRLNISALMCDDKAQLIISKVDELASCASDYLGDYQVDTRNARFVPVAKSSAVGSPATRRAGASA